jgi:hypothetical protein
LPQYFRHNRFQSLVRQLNFYSFRKINRERNVWIYKHDLFNRARPEDLYMVRRRTCPGTDGRKQRFSRFSARKLSQPDGDNSKSDDEDSLSIEAASSILGDVSASRKRDLDASERSKTPASKRSRRLWNAGYSDSKKDVVVDTSMIQTVEDVPVEEEGQDEVSSLSAARTERVELAEQSIVVSEVAMKLDQYARKALGRSSRSRRGGVVTPPYGGSQHYFSSSTSLLTYDDEYHYSSGEAPISRHHSVTSLSGLVSDADDSTANSEEEAPSLITNSISNTVTPTKPMEVSTPPVNDRTIVQTITGRILEGHSDQSRAWLVAPVTIAGFCMSTSPQQGEKDLCSKILQLISSCEHLASEFQLYRSALHPTANNGEAPSFVFHYARENRAVTVQQIWEREASRGDAVRHFKTFAVNCIHRVLGKSGHQGAIMPLSDDDKKVLERTADIWLKSAGALA